MESVCVVWVCKHELLQTVGNRAAEEMAHRMTWTPLIHLWYLHLLFRCGEFYTQNWSSQIAPTCVVSRSVTITPFLPRCCYWFPSRWGGSGWAAFCPPVCPDLLQSRSPAGSGPCNQEEQKEMVTTHFSEHKLTTCSWEIVDVDSSLKALWSTFNVPEMNIYTMTHSREYWLLSFLVDPVQARLSLNIVRGNRRLPEQDKGHWQRTMLTKFCIFLIVSNKSLEKTKTNNVPHKSLTQICIIFKKGSVIS